MSVGMVFASTGGTKMARALRSLRKTEPDLPVHIIFDTSSKTWEESVKTLSAHWFLTQPNVYVKCTQNTSYINGILNAAVSWMRDIGYSHVCLFHDDVVFSPLPEHKEQLTYWFTVLQSYSVFKKASALSFSCLQAFIPDVWKQPSSEWDTIDLESDSLWKILSSSYESKFKTFYTQHYGVKVGAHKWPRLGPTGQIVPVDIWEQIGGFDENEGIFYDHYFPAECVTRGLPETLILPNVPHLHLHNQTIGFADPAGGIWSNTEAAFLKRYGKDVKSFWEGRL